MKILELAYSAYPVTDMARARAFYEGILGLTPSMVGGGEADCWVEYEIQGQALAIANVSPDWTPSPQGGCVALEVDDFEAAVAEMKEKNVPITFGPIESPVCFMAGIADPDGSQIILHKRKSFSTH